MFTANKFLHTINVIFCFEIELLLLLSSIGCAWIVNSVMDPMALYGAVAFAASFVLRQKRWKKKKEAIR
jgi:hypothetical protein